MSPQNIAICKECGKEFSFPKHTKGKRPIFCSPECKRKAHTARTTAYIAKRYRTDPDFRKRRVQQNAASNKKRREESKDSELDRIANEVATMSDAKEIKTYLAKYMRVKSEFYAKPKEAKDGE